MEYLMDFQITIKNLSFNKDKNIGKIIVLVEGEDEIKLLKQIFGKIMDYDYSIIKKGGIIEGLYKSKKNKNSHVLIAKTNSSNIKSVLDLNNYKDNIAISLMQEYGESIANKRIYFIWDRDYESNKGCSLALNTFGNSLDNDYEMNGLLLISYPCLEVYEISNFEKNLFKKKFKNSLETKKYKKSCRWNINRIDENTLLLAAFNTIKGINNFNIYNLDIDNFKETNIKIFNKEEDYYKNYKTWKALSLISIMLLQLDIITIKK